MPYFSTCSTLAMTHKVYVNRLPSIQRAEKETQNTPRSIQTDRSTQTLPNNDSLEHSLEGLKPTVLPKLPKDRWAVMFKYLAANKRLNEQHDCD